MQNLKIALRCNFLFVIAFLFILIYVIISTKIIHYKSIYNDNTHNIEGIITKFSLNGNKLSLEVKAKEKIIVNYYINSKEEKNNILNKIHLGDKLKFQGTMNKPLNNTIPNTFNYKKYLYNKKIYYTFTADQYKVTGGNNIFYKIKDWLLKKAYKMNNGDYFLTFILGDKSLLESAEYNNFQNNGISHLLAISGMHIGILLGVLNTLLKKVKDNLKFAIISIILIFFTFLTSFAASILRATTFYLFNQINKKFNLNFNNLQILFITAFILIIINPFIIYDLGFIYSFIICFGIFYYNDKIKGNYLIKALKLSFISFLFSLPISLLTNYEFNILSILFNIVFVPLISLVVYPLALITFFLPFLNPIFSIIMTFTNTLNSIFTKLSIFLVFAKIPIILVIIYYIFLIIGKKSKKFYYGLIIVLLITKLLPLLNQNYEVYFLDVGQGDSTVLISPHNSEVLMIDTGGKISYKQEDWKISTKSYNLSDNTIKFLKSKGISKIDYLIISHGDADHCGEAKNILNKMKVQNLILNNGDLNKAEKEIKNLANITNDYHLKYFNMSNLNKEIYENENDNSIINYITFLKYKLLFMGDAGIKSEEEIIKKYKLPKIDFLKVGHHGSNTSSSTNFIDKIRPQNCIISVGKNNRYGHPKQSVLDTLNNYKVYRTDIYGSIKIKLNSKEYQIVTFKP